MLIEALLAGTVEGAGNTERRDTDPDIKELTVWAGHWGVECGVGRKVTGVYDVSAQET